MASFGRFLGLPSLAAVPAKANWIGVLAGISLLASITQAYAQSELVTQYQSGATGVICPGALTLSQVVTFPSAGSYVVSAEISESTSGSTPNRFTVTLDGNTILDVVDDTSAIPTYTPYSATGTVSAAGPQTLTLAACNVPAGIYWQNFSLIFTPGSPSAAQSEAMDFVSQRQQILLGSLDFPSITDRSQNGVQVQADTGGRINALAFSASTRGPLTPAEDALAHASVDRTSGANRGDVSFWIDGKIGLHSSGGDVGRFAVTTLGVDKMVSDRVLLGFALEGDWLTSPATTGTISGFGFLTGPYVSVDLGNNFVLNAHALVGRSWNDQTSIQGGATYSGSFVTNRLDLGASLSGAYVADLLTVRPDVAFSLISEGADAYSLSGAGGTLAVPGFNVATIELSAGSSFEYRLDAGNGVVFTPKAGLKLGYDAGSTSSVFAQGSLGVGIQTEAGLGVDLGLQSRLGSNGFRSIAATGTITGHF